MKRHVLVLLLGTLALGGCVSASKFKDQQKRADVLEKTFTSVDLTTSGTNALEIERSLQPARLDASDAYELLLRGERIGHTVAVLQSELK